jgi:hypothetical protein
LIWISKTPTLLRTCKVSFLKSVTIILIPWHSIELC